MNAPRAINIKEASERPVNDLRLTELFDKSDHILESTASTQNLFMRLSLALLSVWTSASYRRGLFTHGFTSLTRYKRASLSQYMSSTLDRRNQIMEPNQPKRPRKEEPNKTRYMGMSSSSEELQERSLYERKIGKMISTCSNCGGEGKIRAPLSKKAKAHRKRMRQNNSSENSGERDITSNNTASQQPPMLKPCPVCDGSGLIAIHPSESNDERELTKNSEAPQVHVAIVGGGIGGIALAVALQQRRIPCVVYERDMSFEERKQGK